MTATDMPEDDEPDALDVALRYAALGWRVVPIAPGTRYPQGLKQWRDAATDDPETIRAWWTGLYRGHGIGIATGPGSGVWALDVDVKEGQLGRDSLEALENEHGHLPVTPTTITGSGGLHLYFRWNDDHPVTNWQQGPKVLTTPFGPGIDIRGEGGQVVAWPTIHPDGNPYQWAPGRGPWELEPAEAPPWLYERLERERTRAKDAPAPSPVQRHSGAANPDPNADSIADHVRATNDFPSVLTAEGWAHHHDQGTDSYWTRPGKNTRDGHSGCLHNSGDGPFVVFTTEISAGLAEAGQTTADGTGVSFTVFDFLAGTRHNGDKSALAREQRLDLNATTRPPVSADTTPKPRGIELDLDEATPEAVEEEERNRHRRALLTEEALAHIVPPSPIADGWFYVRTLSVLYGPPKKGKTFVAIDLAMSVATGQNWLAGPTRQGNVVFCLGEGVAGLSKRIKAWRAHHATDVPANITFLPHTPQLGNGVDVADFIDAVAPFDPDLIIIDTLARASVGVQENDAMEMGRIVAEADRIKDATGACVLLVHHTGKDSTRGTRGSSALTGAIDTGVEVRGDTKAMTLVNTEQKDAMPADELQFRAEQVAESMVFVRCRDLNEASGSTRTCLEALIDIDTGGETPTDWFAQCEDRSISRSSWKRAQKWLLDNGQIMNLGTQSRPLWTVATGPSPAETEAREVASD